MTQKFVYGCLTVSQEEPQLRVPNICTSLKKAKIAYKVMVDFEMRWRAEHENGHESHYLLKIHLNVGKFEILERFL